MAWQRVNASDICAEKSRTGRHKGKLIKCIGRQYCVQCGLMKLKNEVSRRAWRKVCRY